MTLQQLAQEALQNLQIEMFPVFPCQGMSWNVGELAVAQVQITNTTGAPLRDIAVETSMIGSAAEYVVSSVSWDGNGAFRAKLLEPGEVWGTPVALLRGVSAGTFTLTVTVAAEVVPFGTAPSASASYSVLPMP
jgi:hypothetical protein